MQLTLPPLHAEQAKFVLDPHRIVVAACGSKTGKALAVDTPIPTPGGWRTMLDLRVGDQVFDEAGRPVTVVETSDVMLGNSCYRVEFNDGSVVTADAEHLWTVKDTHDRTVRTLTTRELIADGVSRIQTTGYPKNRWQIPTAKPLQFAGADAALPVDAYLFGTWLGDGGSTWATITSADEEILNAWRAAGWTLKKRHRPYDYGITGSRAFDRSCALQSKLNALGVLRAKHIPDCYLRASVGDRVALLQGLMDTDGTCDKRGAAEFYNSNEQLARDFVELAHSLGCKTTWRDKRAILNGKDCGTSYRVGIKAAFPLFRLTRKAARYTPRPTHRTIVRIEPTDSVAVKCIGVDSPSRLYLASTACIPTHNTFGMAIWMVMQAWNRYQSRNWWAGPTLAQSKIAFDLIGQILPPGRFKQRSSKGDMSYELVRSDGSTHSWIFFKSGDNPASLRGEGIHAAVVDEAAFWNYDSFVSVFTTLTRTKGLLRIISTPKGRNWFYREWVKGWYPELREKNPEYWSYQLPTWVNPHIDADAIETFRRQMPADVFRQEIEAQFLDGSAGVFKGVNAAQERGKWRERPIPGAQYVVGVDWAKKADYTVFAVMDRQTRELVHIARHTQIDWNENIRLAIDCAKFWNNALMITDSTGVGDVPLDSIKSVYPFCEGYTIGNNQAKTQLIQKLQLGFERGELSVPNPKDLTGHPRTLALVLERELGAYSYELSSTGKFLFGAPDGDHDDTVIALALAYWKAAEPPLIYRARTIRGL